MKRCLLIMPLGFYSMASHMEKALNEAGYDVDKMNDRYPANSTTKVLCKLGLMKGVYANTFSHFHKYLQDALPYDICIIIKGFGVSKQLIDLLKQKCKRVIGYNFDSFYFHPQSLTWYPYVDVFYTFDYNDAETHNLNVVELYSAIPTIEQSERKYSISVIQKVHSDRLLFLDKVLELLSEENRYIYLFESSTITMVLNFIKHPLLYIKYWDYIHLRSLSYTDYIDVLKSSTCTVDFAHPKQSGITMRCFEAASVGTKILTNNVNMSKSNIFNADCYLVVNDKTSVDLLKTFTKSPGKIIDRSINNFVQDLISEKTTGL